MKLILKITYSNCLGNFNLKQNQRTWPQLQSSTTGSLTKKLLLSVDFHLSWNSVTVLSWLLFLLHIMSAIVITEDWNDIGPNNYVQNSSMTQVLFGKKIFSTTPFPNLFAVVICYMKARPYLVNCKQADIHI